MRLRRSEYDGEGRNQQAVHSITACQDQMPPQDDQLLGLRNDSSPFSDSIAPFRFGGQPSMRTKEIVKCYHLWINPQFCFFQDNGKQTVFVSYKQQHLSPFIDPRYLLIQCSIDTLYYRNMHPQLIPQFVVSEDRSEMHAVHCGRKT